jgi:HEAT repeat protein
MGNSTKIAIAGLLLVALAAVAVYQFGPLPRTAPPPAPALPVAERDAPAPDADLQRRVHELEADLARERDEADKLRRELEASKAEAAKAEPAKPEPEPDKQPDTPAQPPVDRVAQYKSMLESDDKKTRENGYTGLVTEAEAGKPGALEALAAALRDGKTSLKLDMLEYMADTENPLFLDLYSNLRTDPEGTIRGVVAEALGKLPAEQAGPVLMQMLSDSEPFVLRKSVDALGDLKYAPAQPDLTSLTNHHEETVAIEAAIALRRFGDESAAERWVHVLGARANSANVEERLDAAKVLRRMKMESCRPYLETMAKDADSRVRKEAEKGLSSLK